MVAEDNSSQSNQRRLPFGVLVSKDFCIELRGIDISSYFLKATEWFPVSLWVDEACPCLVKVEQHGMMLPTNEEMSAKSG